MSTSVLNTTTTSSSSNNSNLQESQSSDSGSSSSSSSSSSNNNNNNGNNSSGSSTSTATTPITSMVGAPTSVVVTVSHNVNNTPNISAVNQPSSASSSSSSSSSSLTASTSQQQYSMISATQSSSESSSSSSSQLHDANTYDTYVAGNFIPPTMIQPQHHHSSALIQMTSPSASSSGYGSSSSSSTSSSSSSSSATSTSLLLSSSSASASSSGSQSSTVVEAPAHIHQTANEMMKRTFEYIREIDPNTSKFVADHLHHHHQHPHPHAHPPHHHHHPCCSKRLKIHQSSLGTSSSSSSSLSLAGSSSSSSSSSTSICGNKLPWIDALDGLPLRPKLEQRLNGILCCAVCLDLPKSSVYQCPNGHLMCAGCFTHVLADGRLRDESPTCPSCRVSISKESCSRNLAVEKAVCELPGECRFCQRELPRSMLEKHMTEICEERIVPCRFSNIGCPWNGPYHEADCHADTCMHPNKSAREVLGHLEEQERKKIEQRKVHETLFSLLSYEKIYFHDIQFRPYRTDEYIHKLFYETSRFTAFNLQWVVKARVNDDQRDPTQSCERRLSFQLCLKSKINNTITIHYMLLKGPFGETKVLPMIYKFDFTETQTESTYNFINLSATSDSNRLLAARMINFRLIMFQASK